MKDQAIFAWSFLVGKFFKYNFIEKNISIKTPFSIKRCFYWNISIEICSSKLYLTDQV